MNLDIQRALEVDVKLRMKYMIHMQQIAFRITFSLLILVIIIYGIILISTFTFFSDDNLVRVIIIGGTPILYLVTIILIAIFVNHKATLLLYDTGKPLSFSSGIQQIFLLPPLMLFIIFTIFVSLYSLIIRNKRYYFAKLAPFYIIDQNMNPITAIKETYYLIPDDELEHLFGMGNFGYADLYRQIYPKQK